MVMRFVPQEGIEGVGFGKWCDVDAPWRLEIALDVHKLVEGFDPQQTRFREMIEQHTAEAFARKEQYPDDGCIHETGEDENIDGVAPLYLGPSPSRAAKYATLAAIHDEQLNAVRNRCGELVKPLCPWDENDDFGKEVVPFIMLKLKRVPLLSEDEHGELTKGFLAVVRADLGATGDDGRPVPEGDKVGPPRKKSGRKPDTDANADARLFDAWQTRRYSTFSALANEKNLPTDDVKLAIDRERKRRKK